MSYIEWIRSKVGHRKILIAYASVLLWDDQGRLLLQRRADFDVWGLPGGILELGEDILTCARRELREETGLTAGDLSLVGVYSEPAYDTVYPNGDEVQQYTLCFQGRLNGGRMKADGIETRDLAFFAPTEIPTEQVPPWYAAMIRDSLNSTSPVFAPPCSSPYLAPQIEPLRQELGKELIIGMGAVAVTVDGEGRLLIGQRTDDGLWDFPGGYMNLGENVAHTAVRETHEETGLWVVPERILGVFSPTIPWVYPNGDQIQSVVTLFRCRPNGGELQADRVETSRVAWMKPEEILAFDTHPSLARLNHEILAHLDGGYFVQI